MQLQPLKMKTEPKEHVEEKELCGIPDSSRMYLWNAYTNACISYVRTRVIRQGWVAEPI